MITLYFGEVNRKSAFFYKKRKIFLHFRHHVRSFDRLMRSCELLRRSKCAEQKARLSHSPLFRQNRDRRKRDGAEDGESKHVALAGGWVIVNVAGDEILVRCAAADAIALFVRPNKAYGTVKIVSVIV